ncbi:MAG: signal peptidase I [Fusobacteria bacterium]|nr:signal peptidase I [Fusobacteriota bacterium]
MDYNENNQDKKPFRQKIISLLKIVIIALMINILIKGFLIRTYTVESGSMENTLMVQDRVVTEVVSRYFTQPARGDIIVFVFPDTNMKTGEQKIRMNTFEYSKYVISNLLKFQKPADIEEEYVKRIIGLPGDIVDIKNSKVYVNGEMINEPYLENQNITNITSSNIKYPYTVPSNQYFVLGDNRQNSNDSRQWGTVPYENIIGKAMFVFFPISNIKKL